MTQLFIMLGRDPAFRTWAYKLRGISRLVKQITFKLDSSLRGIYEKPQPPIPNQTGVILLQHGEALVGEWDAECCGFVHPVNQTELATEALAAVLESYPVAALDSGEIRVFTCPLPLVARFDWDWPTTIRGRSEV